MNQLSKLGKVVFIIGISIAMFLILCTAHLYDKQQQAKFNDEVVDLIKSNKPLDKPNPDAGAAPITSGMITSEPVAAPSSSRFVCQNNSANCLDHDITPTGFLFGYIPVRQQVSITQGFERIEILTWKTDMRYGSESSITPVEACRMLLDSKGPEKRRR